MAYGLNALIDRLPCRDLPLQCAPERRHTVASLTYTWLDSHQCFADDGSGRYEELDHIYAYAEGAKQLRWDPSPPMRTPHSDHSMLWVNRVHVTPGQL